MATIGKFDAPMSLKGCQFKLGEYTNIVKTIKATNTREKLTLEETKQTAETDKNNIAIQMLTDKAFVKQNVTPVQLNERGEEVLTVEGREYVITGRKKIIEGVDDMILMLFGHYNEGSVTHYNILMKWGVYCGDILVWQDNFEVVRVTDITFSPDGEEISRTQTVFEASADCGLNDGFDCMYIKERKLYRIVTSKLATVINPLLTDSFLTLLECSEFVNSYDKSNGFTTWTYLVKAGEIGINRDDRRPGMPGCYYIAQTVGVFDFIGGSRKVEVTAYFGYKIRTKIGSADMQQAYRWPTTVMLETIYTPEHEFEPYGTYPDKSSTTRFASISHSHMDPDYDIEENEYRDDERFLPMLWPNEYGAEYYKDCSYEIAMNKEPLNYGDNVANVNLYEFCAVGSGSFIRTQFIIYFDQETGHFWDSWPAADWAQSELIVLVQPEMSEKIKAYKWNHVTYDALNNLLIMTYCDVTGESDALVPHLAGYFIRTMFEPVISDDIVTSYNMSMSLTPLLYKDANVDVVSTDAVTFDERTNRILLVSKYYGAFSLNGYIWDESLNKYYTKEGQEVVSITSGDKTVMLARNETNGQVCYIVLILGYDMLNEWRIKIYQAMN